MPERIQLRRTKGWRKPDGAVSVARPTRWGNPFVVLHGSVIGRRWAEVRDQPLHRGVRVGPVEGLVAYTTHSHLDGAQAHAVDLFRRFCAVTARDTPMAFQDWIAPLRGRDLACWCRLDAACHADVLLALANQEALV